MVRVFSTQVDVVKQTISSLSVEEVIASSESVEFITVTESANVSSGAMETSTIRPPAGYLYELLALRMTTNPPTGGGSGSHYLKVEAETISLRPTWAESVYGSKIEFTNGVWTTADSEQHPPNDSEQLLSVRGLRVDSSNGLQIKYVNDTDVTQDQSRYYMLWVRKIKVS